MTTRQPTDETLETRPNEEEIFDYFLGRADPETARGVSAALAKHPAIRRELGDWKALEGRFTKFPLRHPSEAVLNRVRLTARAYLTKSSVIGDFLASLRTVFTPRIAVLAATCAVVAGVALTLRPHLPAGDETLTAANKIIPSGDSVTAITAMRAPATGEPKAATSPEALEVSDELATYDAALNLYRAGRFNEASSAFSKIVSDNPRFEKSRELYSYWIEALKQLGKFELAEKKQKLLEDVIHQ